MIKFLGHLLLSFAIGNWIYSEICLIYPPAEVIGRRFAQVVHIPTHDKWAGIANSKRADQIEQEIYTGLSPFIGERALFSKDVISLWERSTNEVVRYMFGLPTLMTQNSSQDWGRNPLPLHYVSGTDIFAQPESFSHFQDELPAQHHLQ